MIWILAAFLLLHLAFLRQRAGDEAGFFLARRQAPPIKLGMSLVATVLGASAVLGTIGWGYEYGLAGSAWLLAGVVGLGLLWVLVPALADRRAVSIAGLVGGRAGSLSGKAVAVAIVPMWIAVAAAQVKALAALLAAHSSLPPAVAAALVCALVPLYLWRGGQKAVVESDALQFWFIVGAVALGFAATLAAGATLKPETVRPIGAEVPLWTLFPVMLSYLIGPDIHTRLLTTGSTRDRRRALLFAMLTLTAVGLALAAVGWAAHGRVAPAQAWRTGLALIDGLPFPLAAAMNVALAAALLSSLDTTLMTTGTLLAVDLGGGGVRGARWAVLGVSVAAGVVSQAGAGLIPLLMTAYQWYAGVLGPTVLFALFARGRAADRTTLTAVLGAAALLAGGMLLGLPFAFEAAFAWGLVATTAGRAWSRRTGVGVSPP
jgi:SSS family solute:Na+ symporter